MMCIKTAQDNMRGTASSSACSSLLGLQAMCYIKRMHQCKGGKMFSNLNSADTATILAGGLPLFCFMA